MSKKKEPTVIHKAKCIEKKTFLLNQLPTITAYLDAGMSAKKMRGMLFNMYKNKVSNPNAALFCICLMEVVKEGEPTETLSFSKNWNNKLACPYYTTIRLNSTKYEKGKIYSIVTTK